MTEVELLNIIADNFATLVVIEGIRLTWTVFNDMMKADK